MLLLSGVYARVIFSRFLEDVNLQKLIRPTMISDCESDVQGELELIGIQRLRLKL